MMFAQAPRGAPIGFLPRGAARRRFVAAVGALALGMPVVLRAQKKPPTIYRVGLPLGITIPPSVLVRADRVID